MTPGCSSPDGKKPSNIPPVPSVLVVEDDGLIALSLLELLKKSGYSTPDPVASGEDAIEYLKKSPSPDIIIMDIALDGRIDGIETLRQIRKSSGIPVIFLTAHNDAHTLACAGSVSPSGFIVKPFVEGEVLLMIRKTLNR